MAQAEPRNDVASGAGDEIVTSLASSSSASECGNSYVTAGMSEMQISGAIEKSREQGWSEVADRAQAGAGAASCGLGLDDQVTWEELKNRHPRVFTDRYEVKLGRVIAEGGQAHIYEAKVNHFGDTWYGVKVNHYVAKVYKMEGFSLADLQRQWSRATKAPPAELAQALLGHEHLGTVLGGVVFGEFIANCSEIYCATFLKDGKFALVMWRYWGDLRTLINLN